MVGREHREWTEILTETPEIGLVGVTLRNEGPGVALNVRWRARSWTWDIETAWSLPIGSLRTGEQQQDSIAFDVPDGVTAVELGKAKMAGGHEPNYVLWYVETLYSDIRGVTWLVRPTRAFATDEKPHRVRSRTDAFWRPKVDAD